MRPSLFYSLLFFSGIGFALASWVRAQESFTDLQPIQQYIKERISATPEFESDFQEGMSAFQNGDYVQAGEEFGKAAILVSNHPLAQLYFTLCLLSLEKYVDAAEILERAIYFYPPFSSLKLHIRDLYAHPEDFEKHFHQLKQFVQENPKQEQATFLLAFLQYFSGNLSQAKILYQELLPTKRYHSWALYFLRALGKTEQENRNLLKEGQDLFFAGNYLEATDRFIQAHLEATEQPFFLFQISFGLFALQRFEASAEFLKKGMALYSHWSELDLDPQKLYSDSKLYAQKLNQFKTYLGAHERDSNLSLLFGIHLLLTGNESDAMTALQYAKELAPQDQTIQQALTEAQQVKKKITLPLNKPPEEKIAELPPSDIEKSKEWGLESFKARDYIKATKKCLFAVEASPQNRELKYYFALTLFATQRFDLAAKQLEEYLLLNPKQFPEWRPFYTTLEDYQQHYQLLCLSRENQPMNPSLNLLYSILLIQEGKIKEARLQLYKLLETSPNSVAIQTALKLLN